LMLPTPPEQFGITDPQKQSLTDGERTMGRC
jgi:hypothetical protein